MSEEKKFTGFKPEHSGCDVYDIRLGNGKIEDIDKEGEYPINVYFGNEQSECYTPNGYLFKNNARRSLYFGHNIKVEVTGEEIPEPKLICPVCGVEHGVVLAHTNPQDFILKETSLTKCPFHYSIFRTEERAVDAMKNLIKAMEEK